MHQRFSNHILDGLPGVQCLIDDILIFEKNQVEHNARLFSTLNWLQTFGVTLSSEICEFSKKSIKFLGHLIDAEGVRADPSKTSAIINFLLHNYQLSYAGSWEW